MTRKRRTELSALNVLFCLLVIFIHIISYPLSEFQPNTPEYNIALALSRMSSFVVQGFVMLSGVKLFLNGKDSVPFGKYIKSRLKGVIVPYAVCFAVYYICFAIIYNYPLEPMFAAKHFVFGSLVCHLYFIPIIFQFDILFPVWKRIVNRCSAIIVIPFALLVSTIFENNLPQMISAIFTNIAFEYNDRIFTTYLSFWLIGCYIGKHYEMFCDILRNNFRTTAAVFAITLALMLGYSYIAYNFVAPVPYLNYIHNLYVIYVCLFLYAAALKCSEKIFEKIPLLAKIDRASLYIYLYHMMAIFAADAIISKFGLTAQSTAFTIRAVTAYIVTPFLCVTYQIIKGLFKNIKNKQNTVSA